MSDLTQLKINITSFFSIPYYSNVRLISKNFYSAKQTSKKKFNSYFAYFLWEQTWFGKQHKDAI